MATVSKQAITCVMSTVGGDPVSLTFAEGASETFVAGELVAISATGYVTEISSDTPSAILGVAAEDAHNDASAGTHNVSVYLAVETNIFSANCLQSSLADHVLVQADLGRTLAIQRDTTNSKVYLNASTFAGANVRVFTYRTGQNSALADTNALVLFSFLRNWSQMAGTS